MCDPKPGARCSADTWKELTAAAQRLASARRELAREPASPVALHRVVQDEATVQRKQDAYDSAPRGQKELADAIGSSAEPSSPENDSLRTRLYAGRRTRIDQKMALARSLGRSVDAQHREAEKALNRLRHPDAAFPPNPETGREGTLGFFVSPDAAHQTAPEKTETAEQARDLSIQRGQGGFYDAQMGHWVDVGTARDRVTDLDHTSDRK